MIFRRTIYRDETDYPRPGRVTDSAVTLSDALKCFGPSSSKSEQKSEQITQSSAGDNSPVGNTGTLNQGGTLYNAHGDITADPVVTGQAFDAIQSLVGQALSSQNQTAAATNQAILDANGSNQNALNSVLANVLSRDQGIASNTATGGASGQQTFILWLVGIVVAGLFIVPKLVGKIPRKAKA